MVPDLALNNVAYCAFANTKLLSEAWHRRIAGSIEFTNPGGFVGSQLRSPILYALVSTITKAGLLGMLDIFQPGAVLQVFRTVVALVAILMVHFERAFVKAASYGVAFRRLPKEGQSDKVMHLFAVGLPAFPKIEDVVAATYRNLKGPYLPGPTSASRIYPIFGSNTTIGRYFVALFKPWRISPFFHTALLECSHILARYRILRDWKELGW